MEKITEMIIPRRQQIMPVVTFLFPFGLTRINSMKPTIIPITPNTNPTPKKEVIIERIPNTNVALPLLLIKPLLLEILALFIFSTSP